MLDLKGLTKTYPVADRTVSAVRNVDLMLREGEFISIVGHSGSGKSTLLGLMGCITRPDSGTVLIDGNDIWKYNDRVLSQLRNRIFGFVYQFASLIPTLTALENILLPSLFGRKRPREDALALLEQVGLGGKAERYSSELSGGEQRRVAIARAFINDPRVILADEPTGELDEETEASIMDLFERKNRDRKVAVVMVTHSSELARRATRRLRMRQGMIEEAG